MVCCWWDMFEACHLVWDSHLCCRFGMEDTPSLFFVFVVSFNKENCRCYGEGVYMVVFLRSCFSSFVSSSLGYQVACDGRGRGANLVRMLLSIYPSNCSTLILMFNKLLLPSKKKSNKWYLSEIPKY